MTALQIECTCRKWWGRHWPHSQPYVLSAQPTSGDYLPNAPVTIHLLTRNMAEAALLLRLAADALEREPEAFEQRFEPPASQFDDGDEAPF